MSVQEWTLIKDLLELVVHVAYAEIWEEEQKHPILNLIRPVVWMVKPKVVEKEEQSALTLWMAAAKAAAVL